VGEKISTLLNKYIYIPMTYINFTIIVIIVAEKKIGIMFSLRFMYLPNSWNNVKLNCNRKVVFTHLITPFPKSRTTVIPWALKTDVLCFNI